MKHLCLILFQQLILILKGVLAYAIPDTPNNLQTQLMRELHLKQENLYELKHKQGLGKGEILNDVMGMGMFFCFFVG